MFQSFFVKHNLFSEVHDKNYLYYLLKRNQYNTGLNDAPVNFIALFYKTMIYLKILFFFKESE
jgi:hypothetical protein